MHGNFIQLNKALSLMVVNGLCGQSMSVVTLLSIVIVDGVGMSVLSFESLNGTPVKSN
jgi:hypothetical protein